MGFCGRAVATLFDEGWSLKTRESAWMTLDVEAMGLEQ
jgi:hypothetical protein